ncbi:class A sortase [Lactobacillus helsingborgensis]|uniref:class A sortase n=1 Tax=Lactobacillus helsingborgensis TaxID=1218494 RepID=UPI0027417EA6|nr:class A sortase [Lactobacillus helsingborgensis]WLT00274.1 class A sortase [Lactobacillus helsingborgensis]
MASKKQKHSLKDRVWSTIRVFLLSALFYIGVTLIFFGSGFGNSYVVQQNAEKANTTLTQKKADRNKKRKTSYDASKTKSVSAASVLRAKQIKAYAIGRIAIPAVNIHNPLFAGYGDQNQNLEYGVVTCLPDRVMGGANNYVLAGHYMGSYGPAVLDNLHLAHPGDLIYVTDLHHIYTYEIKRISFAIKPTQVEVENNMQDKSMITLITCSDFNTSKYGYGQHRTVAQGDLIGKMKATKHNLAASELIAKPKQTNKKKHVTLTTSNGRKTVQKTTKVRAEAQPKFFQNMTLIRTVIITFNIIFILFIFWRLARIWLFK